MSKISGSCLCGSVRYSSQAEPVLVALCHCPNCQKQTGTSFSIIVAVPAGTLEFASAEPSVYEDVGISGMPVHRHFCSNCGSPIYSDVESTPDLQYVKAGTLDDTSWLQPTMSIWCDTAQTWFALPDDHVKFPNNPPA